MDDVTEFEIRPMSTDEHEDLVAEVMADGEYFLLVTQEAGFEKMRVSIQIRSDGQPWNVSMKDLVGVLTRTTECLWELRKSEP